MAAVCPKVQNGGQNDTFWPNENTTLYTISYCDWSVYFDVFGYKEYIFVIFKIKNGRHIQENPKWPPKWRILWPKYSYDTIHHQSFELKCMCVSFWILLDMSTILQLFLKIQNGCCVPQNSKWRPKCHFFDQMMTILPTPVIICIFRAQRIHDSHLWNITL